MCPCDLARHIAVDRGECLSMRSIVDVVADDVIAGDAQTWAMPEPIWPAPITPTLDFVPLIPHMTRDNRPISVKTLHKY